MDANTPENLSQPPQPKITKKRLWIAGGIAASIVVIAAIFFVSSLFRTHSPTSGTPQTDARADLLYVALGNAAKQPRLKVGMYRETYANRADADTKQHVGSITSSVTEADNQSNKFRAVFAHNFLNSDGSYSLGRCMDGIEYVPVSSGRTPAMTLVTAASQLSLVPAGALVAHSNPQLPSSPCLNVGIYPAPTILAAGRVSDGVFPVHLTDSQAAQWINRVRQANLFTIKDEGEVTKNGKKLRKISLTPRDDRTTSQSLYDIFYAVANIDSITTNPKALWQYQCISINPGESGGVGGYYLIDEKTKLPVYSELYGTNPDKKIGDSPAAGRNIAHTKQSYQFEQQLTITITTPLEFLN